MWLPLAGTRGVGLSLGKRAATLGPTLRAGALLTFRHGSTAAWLLRTRSGTRPKVLSGAVVCIVRAVL